LSSVFDGSKFCFFFVFVSSLRSFTYELLILYSSPVGLNKRSSDLKRQNNIHYFRTMISIKSYKPCLPLQNYIESFHLVENTGNQTIRHQQRVTPNGCFEINFNLGAKIYRRESNGKNQLHPEFCIGSRVTKQYFLSRKGDIKILGIRFYPWGITPFLKIKASEISDNIFSLEEVFGNEIKTLQEQVLNANSIGDAIGAIEAHLIKKNV